MSDELRSVNGLASQVGRYGDVRPTQRAQMDRKQRHHESPAEYRPLADDDKEEEQAAEDGRPGREMEDSGDELLSPLAQELDRLRLVGEHPDEDDLKALRGGRHYQHQRKQSESGDDYASPATPPSQPDP